MSTEQTPAAIPHHVDILLNLLNAGSPEAALATFVQAKRWLSHHGYLSTDGEPTEKAWNEARNRIELTNTTHSPGAPIASDQACAAIKFVHLPKDPPPGLLMSMALRFDHGLGLPGHYDHSVFETNGVTHAQRLESTLSTMRQLYEEVAGYGFYTPEKEVQYATMAENAKGTASAAPQS